VESFDQRVLDRKQGRQHALITGVSAAELQFELVCDAMVASHRKLLQENLRELETLRNQQHELYRKARMRREILDTIRDGEHHSYQQQKNRRDQHSQDDLFLMRRDRK
jgi:flagellar biosynthesis chaperone FliJ